MKLILYYGHTGTTKKAAHLLADLLKDCTLADGMTKNKIDYTKFDGIIFGVNVRGGKLNKRFIKFYKKLKKKNNEISTSCFIIAADEHQKIKYMNQAKELLKEDSYIGFFGGELDPTRAKGLTKSIIQTCIAKYKEQDLPLPSLHQEAIEDFAYHVK